MMAGSAIMKEKQLHCSQQRCIAARKLVSLPPSAVKGRSFLADSDGCHAVMACFQSGMLDRHSGPGAAELSPGKVARRPAEVHWRVAAVGDR